MGLYFKAQLQQMWSKFSDGLDGVDDHTQLRAVLEKERKEQHESI